MMDSELELAKLGVPVKTRHNEVAPNQYEIAPIFENSNVGSDHQQLTMQILQSVARKYGLVCLLHEKPYRRRQRLRQAQQLVDGHEHRPQPDGARRDPRGQPELPVLLRGGHQGRGQAPGPAARFRREHRAGPPPGRQRGAAGDHLDLPGRRAREGLRRDRLGRGRRRTRRPRSWAWAPRCCRRCRCTAATATAPRRSPSRATSSSSARSGRACRSRSRTRC